MAGWLNPNPPRRPVVRYQGAKNRIAPWIISFFPDHKIYVEPYGGSAGVLMQKKRSNTEVYNDLSSELFTIFKVLRDKEKAEELKRLLYLTPWSWEEYLEAHEHEGDETDIERARKGIVRSFMGTGTGSLHCSHCGFFTRTNSKTLTCDAAMAWLTYRDAIPAFAERLQGVIIEHRDALRVIEIYDSEETLFYIDPPYVAETWHSTDMNCYAGKIDDAGHENLLDILQNVKGYVILSGYDSDMYNERLKGWIKQKKTTLNQLNQYRSECIWINPRAWNALRSRKLSLL